MLGMHTLTVQQRSREGLISRCRRGRGFANPTTTPYNLREGNEQQVDRWQPPFYCGWIVQVHGGLVCECCGRRKKKKGGGCDTWKRTRPSRFPFIEPLFFFFTRCWFRWTLCRYVNSSKPFEQKLAISSERKKTRKTLMFQFDDSCFQGKIWDNRGESFINDVCIPERGNM